MMGRSQDTAVFLAGERISLCPLRKKDAPLYVKWFNNAEITDNLALMRPMTLEREEEGLDRLLNSDPSREFVVGIWLNEPWQLIGGVGLHGIDSRNQKAEPGIFIGDKSLWGHGHGSEALQLVIEYAFDTLNLHKLTIRYYGHNERAGKVYARLGFREVGRYTRHLFIRGSWQDEVFMELFREDFVET